MRVIEPATWEIEKNRFKEELSVRSDEYYVSLEKENIKRLFDFTFTMQSDDELTNVDLIVNPYVKPITLPYVFEHPEENALRGPLHRNVVLIPTCFVNGDISIHAQQLGPEKEFFHTLYRYQKKFTVNSLLEEIEKTSKNENFKAVHQRFLQFIKKLLHQQILVMAMNVNERENINTRITC